MTDDLTDEDSLSETAPCSLPPLTKKSADNLLCSSLSIVTCVKSRRKQSPLPLHNQRKKQKVSFNSCAKMIRYSTRSRTQNKSTKRSASNPTKQLSKKAKSASVAVDAASTKSGMYYILYYTFTFFISMLHFPKNNYIFF